MISAPTFWHSEFAQLNKDAQIELIGRVQRDANKSLIKRLDEIMAGHLSVDPRLCESSRLAHAIKSILDEYR